jgi:Macrocin-O-methyltransferase (TylF)
MRALNAMNGADKIIYKRAEIIKDRFQTPIFGLLGTAYGGEGEHIGKMCKQEGGLVFMFDTFTGHPRQISYSDKSHEAYCMQPQYDMYGTEELDYDYQRKELDRQGLDNVRLVKGLINDDSFRDIGVNHLHFAFLDLDFLNAMALGLTLVQPLLVKGGYLAMHDVVPRTHIFGLWGLYQEIMASGQYRVVDEVITSYLVVLEKL